MGLKDAHDPRSFTTFAKLNTDGTVAALVEVADTALLTHDPNHDGNAYVEVTDLKRSAVDLFALKIAPEAVAAALAKLPEDRLSLGQDVRAAFAQALPNAIVASVFDGSKN